MTISPRELLPVRRVALLSVHTSPLDQPGTGDGGGLNVYVREIARRMAARGVTVDVFTRATDPRAPASTPLPGSPGVTVHRIVAGPRRPLDKLAQSAHLSAFALALLQHPTAGTHDVVHAHYWLSGWVARFVADRWDVPFVQTFHTLGVLKNRTLAPGDAPESELRLGTERRVAAAADRVLTLTCGEARLLYRTFGLSGAHLAVVPAGVDLATFGPDGPADATGWPTAGPRLLFVGRLQRLKGPDLAIRTLAAVRRSHPDAGLLIVGGASGSSAGRLDPATLDGLAADLGVGDAVAVSEPRPQEELPPLYRAADVVLVPSRSETFGLVALEAQACGTPVVGTRVTGLEYVVRQGGTLVDDHDPETHAAAVTRYLTDPAAAAAAARGGIDAARHASWDATVDRLMDVYGRVVEERSPLERAG